MKLKDKVKIYESFLHKLSIYCTVCDSEGISELVSNADKWSYMHRVGENPHDKKREKAIEKMTLKLCDTPNTDKITKERQRQYKENF